MVSKGDVAYFLAVRVLIVSSRFMQTVQTLLPFRRSGGRSGTLK